MYTPPSPRDDGVGGKVDGWEWLKIRVKKYEREIILGTCRRIRVTSCKGACKLESNLIA